MQKFKPLPSCERLHKLFTCDAKIGILTRRISVSGVKRRLSVGTIVNGYLSVRVDRQLYKVHRIIWKMVNGSDPIADLDHIDGNTLNNSIENLRCATRSQNKANMGTLINNTSGFKGVSYHKSSKKWQASICVNGKQKHLGLLKTPEEAAQLYAAVAKREFGEFARASKATGGE